MQGINILVAAYIICLTAGCVFGRAMKFENIIAKNHEIKPIDLTTVSAPAFAPTRTTVSAPAFDATRKTLSTPAFDTKYTNLTRRESISLMFNETGTMKVPKKLFDDAFTNMEE